MSICVCVCACISTSVFTYITSCTSSLGWLSHYSCTLSSGVHWLNHIIFLCLRPRCHELFLRSVFPTYESIQEARWEPNWFWIQTVSFKKMCSCTPVQASPEHGFGSSSYLDNWYISILSWRESFLEAGCLQTFVVKRPLTFCLHRTKCLRSKIVCVSSWEVESQECQAG